MRTRTDTRDASEIADGILLAPLSGDPWPAIRALRRGMRAQGSPDLVFLFTVDHDGRLVSALDRGAAAILLGFRNRTAA
ncbi:MAG TPA: hypothetical protein VGB28_00355 [Actinomycetota bacterium]|jgi:hypothetical protein